MTAAKRYAVTLAKTLSLVNAAVEIWAQVWKLSLLVPFLKLREYRFRPHTCLKTLVVRKLRPLSFLSVLFSGTR